MEADFVAAFAANELPDGDLEVLGLEVPEGDVYGADRAGEDGAAEGGDAVEVLPMVLGAEGVLADEVAAEGLDYLVHRVGVTPAGGLAVADEAVLGGDADELRAAHEERLDFGDLE